LIFLKPRLRSGTFLAERLHLLHIETDIEEAETDIEEPIVIRTSLRSQRSRVSYAREASQSAGKAKETFIIFDCSDDEDYVLDNDIE
jgi:hypothetical protein